MGWRRNSKWNLVRPFTPVETQTVLINTNYRDLSGERANDGARSALKGFPGGGLTNF